MGLKQVYDLTGPSVPEVDPTRNPCPRCDRGKTRGKTLRHARLAWSEHNYLVYCLQCGYYKEAVNDALIFEGITFPVECIGCKHYQSWIRVPPFFRGQAKEALRLTYWTCDQPSCRTKQTIFESLIQIDKIKVPPQGVGV